MTLLIPIIAGLNAKIIFNELYPPTKSYQEAPWSFIINQNMTLINTIRRVKLVSNNTIKIWQIKQAFVQQQISSENHNVSMFYKRRKSLHTMGLIIYFIEGRSLSIHKQRCSVKVLVR